MNLLVFLAIFSIIAVGLIQMDYTAFAISYQPPPLKQINDGVEPANVTCTEGLELVLKKSNGNPACIKPSSVAKLIERGWAIHILPDYQDENNNSEIFATGNFDVEYQTVNYFDKAQGFLAMPSEDGKYPGIVMIHEWWGLNDNIKEMAKKLASHGYVVLAVDLYNGEVATTSEQARQLVTSFQTDVGIKNMNAATQYIQENHNVEKLGSIGWCFGGAQSLNLALNNQDMDATIIYYGRLVTEQESLSSINWPVLGIFAELDQGIPVDSVREFETLLNELEIPNSIYIFEGVDHAFANPSGERYAPDESKDAWNLTLEFLKTNLMS